MIEMFSAPFFQNALFAGLLASLACGIVGAYIVVKRISFISGSIAHSCFGGIGIAYFLGVSPLGGAMVFGLGTSMAIGAIRKKFKQQEDTLIGAVWALGMAIGIIFINLTAGYAPDLFSYLFGNILLTSLSDVWILIGLDAAILLTVAVFYRAFQAIAFDEDYATILNLPVYLLYLLLLALVAVTTVILIKVVGVILVIALLTLPAAAAKNFCRDLAQMMVLATLFGAVATASGIVLSYVLNLPSGPVIIIISTLIYVVSLAWKLKAK
jgi:zinc transport system permease protein